jgi:exodeoxyribonuclease VIII
MIDLETLGRRAGCVVTSIGAVAFDPRSGEMFYPRFYEVIDLDSSLKSGLKIEAQTFQWWLKQSDAARAELCRPGELLQGVLERFAVWFRTVGGKEIWSHGANFDIPILECAFAVSKRPIPWEFWDARDTRTLFDIADVKVDRSKGVHHNALADAENQARTVIEAYKILRGRK